MRWTISQARINWLKLINGETSDSNVPCAAWDRARNDVRKWDDIIRRFQQVDSHSRRLFVQVVLHAASAPPRRLLQGNVTSLSSLPPPPLCQNLPGFATQPAFDMEKKNTLAHQRLRYDIRWEKENRFYCIISAVHSFNPPPPDLPGREPKSVRLKDILWILFTSMNVWINSYNECKKKIKMIKLVYECVCELVNERPL